MLDPANCVTPKTDGIVFARLMDLAVFDGATSRSDSSALHRTLSGGQGFSSMSLPYQDYQKSLLLLRYGYYSTVTDFARLRG